MTHRWLSVLFLFAGAAMAGDLPRDGPLSAAPPIPPAVRCLEKIEFEIVLPDALLPVAATDRHDATDADGDGRGLAAWAEFVSPTGTCQRMPAFFKQIRGKWKLLARFSVEEPGRWRVRWRATDAQGATGASAWGRFTAKPSPKVGFLRTPTGARVADVFPPQTLIVRQGGAYRPFLGIATARAWNAEATPDTPADEWPGQKIDLEEDLFIPMRRHGVNVLVHWFAPWDTQLVHRDSGEEPWTVYDQRRAEKMDRLVELAEKYGLKLFLSIWNHPALREADRPWELGVYSRGPKAWQNGFSAFGGGLKCADFFQAHDKATGKWAELWAHQANLLRYIVARWGYSPAVGAWTTVCLPQGMTGWSYRQRFHRWHDSVVRCLRHHDPMGRPLSAVSWRETQPWVGGDEEVDIAQFCCYPNAFYFPGRTMLDDRLRSWGVGHMYSRTRDALIGRPLKPVFCGEYALIERKRPSDTLLSHGRRYPEFLRLVSWSALLAGASILPAEWNDGARFGEHVGRQADGQLLYDNFAELALIARFVHGSKDAAGDFPLDLRHAKEPITLPQVGGVAPLALSLHRNDGGTVEMIGWLPRALGEGAGTDVGTLSLPGLVRNSEYRGCFHRVPEGTLSPVRFVTDGCGQGLIDLPEYRHTVAFKLRLSEGM